MSFGFVLCPLADVLIWDRKGLKRTKGQNMDYAVCYMDGAYKARLHIVVPFIGGKTLTVRQKGCGDVHGFCSPRSPITRRHAKQNMAADVSINRNAIYICLSEVHKGTGQKKIKPLRRCDARLQISTSSALQCPNATCMQKSAQSMLEGTSRADLGFFWVAWF
jgi:hypothetical protein|mmetsp:Transcript_81859/g.136842  ORF Transcript_81859/g.136842 Transcript_81859/m.136842 type:complete len:163 (+) Transcript_81859:16-504(+)